MARIHRFSIASFLLVFFASSSVFAQSSVHLAAVKAVGETVVSQAPVQPLVTVMITSQDEVFQDLKFILGEGKNGSKAYGKLKSLLWDEYIIGDDPKKPVMDTQKPAGAVLFLEKSKLKTIFFVPVKDVAMFFDTLADLGVTAKKEGGGFYKVSELFQGYARFSDGYVYFAESKQALLQKIPAPAELFKDFLAKKYDIAARINGEAVSMEDRRAAFGEVHKEMLAAIKPLQEEAEVDFKIREAFIKFQLDEIERFFAESKSIELGWTTDVPNKVGKVHIELEALPETELAKTVAVLEQTDGKANAAQPTDHVSFGSSHFVFDEMRKGHLKNLLTRFREKLHVEIAGDKKLTAADKKAAKQVGDVIFDLLDANTEAGSLKGWLKVIKNAEGKHTLVDQTTVANADDVVKMLKKSGAAQMNVDADPAGNADIHKVELPGELSGLKGQFGDDLSLYFATGKNALKNRIWVSMGHDAVNVLKQAIAANEEQSPVAFQFRVDVGSWVDALTDPEKKKPAVKPKKKKFARKRRGSRSRKTKTKKKGTDVERIAWEILGKATDDILLFSLEKVDENRVEINERIDTGLLRFVGEVLAKEINASLPD